MLSNDILNRLLLLLQRLHHVLLLSLLAFQSYTFALTLSQQLSLLLSGLGDLLELSVDSLLLRFDFITLNMLVGSIFTHEAQTAIHLCQVVSTENKHQLTLRRTVAVHVAHRLDILLLTVCQHLLQLLQLHAQRLDF